MEIICHRYIDYVIDELISFLLIFVWFKQIVEKCPKLERIYLAKYGPFPTEKLIPHLEVCLPAAANLRDFRFICIQLLMVI